MDRGSRTVKLGILAVLIVYFIGFNLSSCSGETIVVDDDLGSWADYQTIGDAVNASNDFDTIRVYSGEYQEQVILNTSIFILGNETNSIIHQRENNTIFNTISNSTHFTNLSFIYHGFGELISLDSSNNTIQNCSFHGNNTMNDAEGAVSIIGDNNFVTHSIFSDMRSAISNTGNRIILRNNDFINITTALTVSNTNHASLMYNRVNSSHFTNSIGISITDSNNITIQSNELILGGHETSSVGIECFGISDLKIISNVIYDPIHEPWENTRGIEIEDITSFIISRNVIITDTTSVEIKHASDGRILNNNISTIGIYCLFQYNNSDIIIQNNSYYCTNGQGIFIDDSEDIIIHNSTLYGNLEGIHGHMQSGINVLDTDRCWINDSKVTEFPQGVSIGRSSNVWIRNVSCNNNNFSGFQIVGDSQDVEIINCTAVNNHFGVNMTRRWGPNNYISFINNRIENNQFGFNISYSRNVSVIRNHISNNTVGIHCYSSDVSVSLCYIEGNQYGIRKKNTTSTIFQNSFIDNDQQAYGVDSSPFWDNGTVGNYWSDYTGVDRDHDGIGDEPYNITVDSQDRYPLIKPNGTRTEPFWIVDDDNGSWADYNTMQDAINGSSPGDTIRVFSGTYYENILVNKTLTIIGNDTADTVIDGRHLGNVVLISADWGNFTGFSVVNGMDEYNLAGIKIVSSNCTIAYNLCSISYYGIYADETEDVIIENNTAIDCTSGIRANEVFGALIKGNDCYDNSLRGIDTSGASTAIQDNTCYRNGYGIYSIGPNNTIHNNTCYDNEYSGIVSGYISKVNDNICMNDSYGITLLFNDNSARRNVLKTNRLGGINMVFPSNVTLIDNAIENGGINIAGLRLEHWSTHDISTSNTVNGYPIYYYKNISGVNVASDAGQVIIANCSDMTAINMELSNCSVGINMGFTDDSEMINVTCVGNWAGIFLINSHNNLIADSNFKDNEEGIVLYSNSSWNSIENNSFINNDRGVSIWGMEYDPSDSNSVTGNTFENSSEYAVFMDEYARYNMIHHNTITGGNESRSRGWDESGNNTWDDNVSEGNWWPDYDGQDLNDDGVGEHPYLIEGPGNATDRYPFTDNVGILDVNIAVSSNPCMQGYPILIFVKVEQSFPYEDVNISFFFDDVLIEVITLDINGTVIVEFEFEPKREGEFGIKIIVESSLTIERTISLSVSRHRHVDRTDIPYPGLMVLGLIVLVMGKIRRY